MVRSKQFMFLVLLALVLVATVACAATTTASCAFVVGDGTSGDAKLHKVLYPGQEITIGTHEKVSYIPCNSRNYLINDGTQVNANGQKVGDRFTLIPATLKSGVKVQIAASAFWTPNQAPQAMALFYDNCFKYSCFSDKDVGGGANYSTPGWNGMLGETFGPAMDRAALVAASNFDDEIWKKSTADQYKKLGDAMSQPFMDAVRARLGYSTDLFCASGNSGWSNPSKPGTGEYSCLPVRISVDDVRVVQNQTATQSTTDVNQQRYDNAQRLYGDQTNYWLGVQDSIDKCKGAVVPCVINVGPGRTNPAVVINPTPVPPTPVKK